MQKHFKKCSRVLVSAWFINWYPFELFKMFDLFEQAGLCRCLVWKNIGKGWTMPCSTVRKFSTWGSNKGPGKVYILLLLLAVRAICYWKMLEGVGKWSQSQPWSKWVGGWVWESLWSTAPGVEHEPTLCRAIEGEVDSGRFSRTRFVQNGRYRWYSYSEEPANIELCYKLLLQIIRFHALVVWEQAYERNQLLGWHSC